MSLLSRKAAARMIGISDLDRFEADNPGVVEAAGVRVMRNGQPTIRYREGALFAWLHESPAVGGDAA